MDRLFHLTSPDPERPCRVETRCRQSCLGFAFSGPWRCCHRAGVAARALEPEAASAGSEKHSRERRAGEALDIYADRASEATGLL